MSSGKVGEWLSEIGLARYAELFAENEIDFDVLSELTEPILREMGVGVLGHRLKILKAVSALTPAVPAHAEGEGAFAAPERRQLTIMFCDLVNSTGISAKLDPEDYRDVMRAYQEASSAVVGLYGGHIAKYLGDGILIYFGYPQAQEDAAERAVRTGLGIVESIGKLKPPSGVKLQVRVGIATGLVVAGDLIGQGVSESSAVSGETPNLASRLQTLATPNTVIIANSTRHLLGAQFEYEMLKAQHLKGFDEPITAWRVIRETRTAGRFEARARGPITPMVGRQKELGVLTERWRKACDGHGQMVMLCGEPGIGKSRLMQELYERTRGEAAATLRYQCSAYFTNSAFYPIRRQLENAARFAPEDDDEAKLDKLEALLLQGTDDVSVAGALFASMLSLPTARYPRLNVSPGLQKRRTIEAMAEQMEGLSESGPLLIFFEDAHWADPTSIDMLNTLVARIADRRVLFVITFRPEFEPPWATGDHVVRCDLSRLSTDEIAEVIAHVAGDAKLPQELREQLSSRTDGNPLYVEELTKSVLESEIGRGDGAAAPIYAIPSSLQDTLMARLDRLSSVKEVAQLGAVLGREFSTALMEAVSPLEPYALHKALEQLEHAALISRRRTEFEDVWTFKHALIQDAAYESILKSRRQQLHLAIAEVIEKEFPARAKSQPEYLAHHFTMAGQIDRAVPYWLAAGASAWGRAAAKEALAHLGRGLELMGGVSDPAKRDVLELKLQSTLGVVHFAATSYASPQAQAAFIRANELCDQVGDLDLRVAVLYGLGAFQTMKGDFRAGHAAFENLLAAATETGSPRYMIYTHSMLAWSHYNRGDFRAAVEHGDAVLKLYDEGGWTPEGPRLSAADPRVISECFRAVALWSLGYPDQAAKAGEEVLDYARTLSDPYSLAYALNFAALLVPDLSGHPEVVLERSTEGVKLARDLGYLFMEVFGNFWRARAISALEDPEAALEMEADAREKCEKLGVRYHEAHLRAHQARMLLAAGRKREAVAALDGLEDSVEETGEFSQSAEIKIAIGDVLAAAGGADRAKVEAAYAEALEIAREQDAKSWELRAALALARLRGDAKAARELVGPVAEWFTEGFDTPDLKAAKALLERPSA